MALGAKGCTPGAAETAQTGPWAPAAGTGAVGIGMGDGFAARAERPAINRAPRERPMVPPIAAPAGLHQLTRLTQ